MKCYIIYEIEYHTGKFIVELLNECDMQNVQKELTQNGYIIEHIITNKYIKCYKQDEE